MTPAHGGAVSLGLRYAHSDQFATTIASKITTLVLRINKIESTFTDRAQPRDCDKSATWGGREKQREIDDDSHKFLLKFKDKRMTPDRRSPTE